MNYALGISNDDETDLSQYEYLLNIYPNAIPYTNVINQALSTTSDVVFNSTAVGNGSVAAPSFAFSTDKDTGIYHPSSGELAITLNNARCANFTQDNISIGHLAQFENTSSSDSVVIGRQAGRYGTNMSNSTLIGSLSGCGISGKLSGIGNTFIGHKTGYVIENADYNTIVGSLSGINLTTGDNNQLFGYNVAPTLTTGSNNICIGDNSDVTLANTTYAMAIGNGAKASSACITIGQAVNYSGGISLAVKCGIGQTAGTDMLEVNGSIVANNTFKTGDGSLLLPSYTFTNDTNTGLYSHSANTIGFSVDGSHAGFLGSYAGGSVALGFNTGLLLSSNSKYVTAIGVEAGKSIVGLSLGNYYQSAVLIGAGAGQLLTDPYSSVIIGCSAAGLGSGTGGYENAIIGNLACGDLTSGYRNTAVGYNAGRSLTTGIGNVFIGYGSNVSAVDTSNCIAIGSSVSAATNEIRIGNSSNAGFWVKGIQGSATGTTLKYASDQIVYDTSSARFKNTIEEYNGNPFILLNKLAPKTFYYNSDVDKKILNLGLIAEDVELIDPQYASYISEGVLGSVEYSRLVVPVICGLKILKNENTELKSQIQDLNMRLTALEQKYTTL